MTRRDFIAIAKVLVDNQDFQPEVGEYSTPKEFMRLDLITGLAEYFAGTDEHFDQTRFFAAAHWYPTCMGVRTE